MMLHRALDRTALLPPFAWRTWPGRAITASVATGRAAACGARPRRSRGTLCGRRSAIPRDSGPQPGRSAGRKKFSSVKQLTQLSPGMPHFWDGIGLGQGGCGVEDNHVEPRSLVVERSAGRNRPSRARSTFPARAPRRAAGRRGRSIGAGCVLSARGAHKADPRRWRPPAHGAVTRVVSRQRSDRGRPSRARRTFPARAPRTADDIARVALVGAPLGRAAYRCRRRRGVPIGGGANLLVSHCRVIER